MQPLYDIIKIDIYLQFFFFQFYEFEGHIITIRILNSSITLTNILVLTLVVKPSLIPRLLTFTDLFLFLSL